MDIFVRAMLYLTIDEFKVIINKIRGAKDKYQELKDYFFYEQVVELAIVVGLKPEDDIDEFLKPAVSATKEFFEKRQLG